MRSSTLTTALVTAPWALVAALWALAAGCSSGHQVVIELAGGAPGADRIEVVLLEPVVLAKEQRHNDPARAATDTTLETVFYMAERSRTTLALESAGTDGFQLEIRDAGGPYVPLVAALSGAAGTAAEKLLALGVYDPASISKAELGGEHTPSTVSPQSDVTIFPIQLEPVDRVFAPSPTAIAPTPVRPREVLQIACAGTGATSGFAWRRADGFELRVLLPLAEAPGIDRLDPPDLDCDQHSPGRAGVVRGRDPGDQRDCDDTALTVNAGVRERCSALDEDCNPLTTLSPAPCTLQCTGTAPLCACDDGGRPESCLAPVTTGPCKVPAMPSSGAGRLLCDSVGALKLPACAAGCEVLLAWAPEGLEVSISDDPTSQGYGLGKWAPLTDATAFLSVHGTRLFGDEVVPVIARVKAGGTIIDIGIPLQPFSATCGAPSTFDCPVP